MDKNHFAPPKKPWFLLIPKEIPTNVLVSTMVSFRGATGFRFRAIEQSGAWSNWTRASAQVFCPGAAQGEARNGGRYCVGHVGALVWPGRVNLFFLGV